MKIREEHRIDMPTFFYLHDKSEDRYLKSGTKYIYVEEKYEVMQNNCPIGITGWYVSLRSAVSIELICRNSIKVI